MSLFQGQEVDARYYEYSDSETTKITDAIDFDNDSWEEIKVNIIRISDTDAIVEGDILGEYRANVRALYDFVARGGVIWISATQIYQIAREPRYNKLLKRYHLNLKEAI
jgi:hypothetical protein